MRIYGPEDPWQDAILFPVEERRVFVETESGPRLARRYKAIVRGDTGATIAVVGDRYRVLENRRALHWGLLACTTAFAETTPDEWKVTGVEAPLTGGHCHITLGRQPDRLPPYEWRLGQRGPEIHEPFVRVRNGYNGRTAFSITIGVTRQKCSNEMVVADKSGYWLKVDHDGKMADEIRRAFRQAKVQAAMGHFQTTLTRLTSVKVSPDHFAPLVRRALRIRSPKGWMALEAVTERLSDEYVKELGPTAYALWAVITDLATRPPLRGFGRRSRNNLQWLANGWLHAFDNAIQAPDFDSATYVRELSDLSGPNG